ncbi:MAG: alpha-amylase family glycosyl hydrolase [Candidatus Cloacimonadales bacterium]|nr:alpha-amylase family glycosyl hydrolase [Candidatus Cloacimonadales bacterium]
MVKKSKTNLKMKSGIPFLKENINLFGLGNFNFPDNSLQLANDKQAQEIARRLQQNEQFTGISAGELFGLNLIVRAYRQIINIALQKMAPESLLELAEFYSRQLSKFELLKLKVRLQQDFQIKENEIITESIVIWLCNENSAFLPFRSLFADLSLRNETKYIDSIDFLEDYFSKQPPILDDHKLFDLLLLPAQKHPYSIYDQLNFLRFNFGDLLQDILWSILTGIDLLQEEKAFHGGGPGPTQTYEFSAEMIEYERFSEDRSWMSNLVLIGKSTYVWLAQLSRKYNREITRLDQIPEEELRILAERGFNGLWLIGIWERSHASKKIKQLTGNEEAIASAYSLKNYHVAPELGGDEAMHNLQRNAWQFGLRIGCDMVPNHMGIDSDWIVQHPDWFLQTDEPPFPAYRFHSQNLSDRDEIEVVIEDHYYEKSDAAVVYKLHDRRDGRSRYIYHGNDGTSIPWNDTAQLNYLLSEVREGVIKEIVSIAKSFPIIRFDAAMTLAKRHIQRLWFPQKGKGGDIPSRSRYALTNKEFDLHIPNEFWREVVDRVAEEAPDTLLLAEAFWMMEGYFVRTLGMHRVYNSAFMNMLKTEENAKYRESIKNVLAFNPQILKRFVNFMSNPDEDTAIAQFGTNDKYFGVCVVMATMPGLPMFAHGQVEGFTERYGMEYARPRNWESVDEDLVRRHEAEIFPLLRSRKIFAEVDNFLLFDFRTTHGDLNENVFAYANEEDGKRSLVVYHNIFAETSGYVHKAYKPVANGDGLNWQEITLAQAWHLQNEEKYFTIFTDVISGLTYLRRSAELHQKGLYIMLGAFKYAVYWDVWEVGDTDGNFERLHDLLNGKGTSNLHRALKRLELSEMLDALQAIISPILIKQLLLIWKFKTADSEKQIIPELKDRLKKQTDVLLATLEISSKPDFADLICTNLLAVFKAEYKDFQKPEALAILLSQIIKPFADIWEKKFGTDWFRQALIADEIEICVVQTDPELAATDISLLTGLLVEVLHSWPKKISSAWLQDLFSKPETKRFLSIHEYDKKIWFNQESYRSLMRILQILISIKIRSKTQLSNWKKFIDLLKKVENKTEYQTEKLFDLIEKEWQDE